jgi:hypothetical protein
MPVQIKVFKTNMETECLVSKTRDHEEAALGSFEPEISLKLSKLTQYLP